MPHPLSLPDTQHIPGPPFPAPPLDLPLLPPCPAHEAIKHTLWDPTVPCLHLTWSKIISFMGTLEKSLKVNTEPQGFIWSPWVKCIWVQFFRFQRESEVSIYILCALSHFSVSDYDPMDCRPSGSSVHVILQARSLDWVAISFCRGSSWSEIEPTSLMSPALADRFFTTNSATVVLNQIVNNVKSGRERW